MGKCRLLPDIGPKFGCPLPKQKMETTRTWEEFELSTCPKMIFKEKKHVKTWQASDTEEKIGGRDIWSYSVQYLIEGTIGIHMNNCFTLPPHTRTFLCPSLPTIQLHSLLCLSQPFFVSLSSMASLSFIIGIIG